MDVNGCVALVTGAPGGIGRAFVAELMERGAPKVYLGARDTASLADLMKVDDKRLVPMALDVTDASQVARDASDASDVTLLINNVDYACFQDALVARDMTAARREIDVNYFGPLALTRAFVPLLAAAGGGAVLNMLSMAALVSLPVTGTYSASKAAFLSLTRSMRAELAAQGTTVVGVLAVQTESAIGAQLRPPRMVPGEVVADALDAIEDGRNEEVIAGALSRVAYQAFTADPKGFQAKMSVPLPQ
jgi:short-subunit dehydrogenase